MINLKEKDCVSLLLSFCWWRAMLSLLGIICGVMKIIDFSVFNVSRKKKCNLKSQHVEKQQRPPAETPTHSRNTLKQYAVYVSKGKMLYRKKIEKKRE